VTPPFMDSNMPQIVTASTISKEIQSDFHII
jgi:hypothetical protein